MKNNDLVVERVAQRVSQLVRSKADSVEKGKVTKYSKVINTGKENIWIEYIESSSPEVEDSLKITRGMEEFVDSGICGIVTYKNILQKTPDDVNNSYLSLLGKLERLLEKLPNRKPKIIEKETHKIDYDYLVEELRTYNPLINRTAPLFCELETIIKTDPKICTRQKLCTQSSQKIEKVLIKKGINFKIRSNLSDLIKFKMGQYGHCFLRDGDLILDVTYRQFLYGSEGNTNQLPALYMGNIEGLAKLFKDNKTLITDYVKNNILRRNKTKVLTDKMAEEFVCDIWR